MFYVCFCFLNRNISQGHRSRVFCFNYVHILCAAPAETKDISICFAGKRKKSLSIIQNKMKRQAERDSSPTRAIAKRIRERDRDRDGSRREDVVPPPLAALLSESRNYHKHQARSRSRERDRLRLREERGAADSLHRQHHRDLGLSSRPPLRTTAVLPKSKAATELLTGRGGGGGLEYKTLLISNLGSQLSDEQVEDGLFHEFKKFGDVSVKLSHTPELGRVAYVNFRHPDNAKEARRSKARLVMYDRPLKVEAVYVRRRSCTPPDAGYAPLHGPYPYRQRSLSPGANKMRDARARHYAAEGLGLSRDRERALDYYSMLDERARALAYQPPEEDLMPEDDQRATRNLFIGNLDHNVSEAELRRGFDKYGIIEEVVIKRPARGQGGAYAFLNFQNLDMAHRAKVAMSGRVFGGNPVKIGYGKPNPTTRLWVGGLGPGASLAALAREFDRFGSIRTIDYVKGDSFAYIQYESLDAAQAACAQMRGFPLGGPDRRLRVDFAKAEEPRSYTPQYAPPPLPPHYDLLADGYGWHRGLAQELRARDRTPPHALFPERDRDRPFLDRADWAGASDALEAFGRGRARSRSRERWDREREAERGTSKGWEERRKRRSLSSERACEDRGRGKARAQPPEAPDRSPNEPPAEPPEPPAEDRATPGGRDEPERNHRPSEAEAEQPDPRKPGSLAEFAQTLPAAWHGSLVLKNSSFPTSMHLLEGGAGFLSALLRDQAAPAGHVAQLKIAQRLRLDQPKLDEVTRRMKQGGAEGYAVLLAVQGPLDRGAAPPEPGLQTRLLRNLVTYLRNKQAAGVIGLPAGGAREREVGGMLYAFPPCEFSQQYLQTALSALGKVEEEHLVVIIVKDSV
ncbi:putative RNA-binding protein 15B [Megalops cyprinoides]|uniref:putative RNA-binding protein 15B n=1 Tax=Megalops cyprinoides TaxID=118141 RepID=UPI0018649FB0|nr:putative RNA-binding protein 15B [Megalops cyprinoides]